MEKLNRVNRCLLVIFFALQPILELILSLFKDNKLAIGGISIATIIRYGLIFIIVALAIINNLKRKSTKLFIGILITYVIYLLLQYFNIKNFNIVILGNSINNTFLQSGIYISKFIIPICILYLVYILNFRYIDFKISILSVVAFTSLSIIVTNLLGIDYIAYSFIFTPQPVDNIIGWFSKNYELTDWRLLTSRGMYPSGNELSSLLVLLMPITCWISLKEKKNWYFVLLFIQMISMLLVGTRVAVYGEIILYIAVVCIWIFEKFLTKQPIEKVKIVYIILISALFLIFFCNSPFYNRIETGEGGKNAYVQLENKPLDDEREITNIQVADNKEESDIQREENIIYIEKNYKSQSIPQDIIEDVYNYKEHTDFWLYVLNDVEFSKRDNARKLKTLILEDIKNQKGDVLDSIVGLGELPVYPEQDYIAQYYYIGIIGLIIFLIPFILILLISYIYYGIKILTKKVEGLPIVLLVSLTFITIIAYLAGHVLEPVYINSCIALISGMLIKSIIIRKKGNINNEGLEKYISKIYSEKKNDFIKELKYRIIKEKKTFIVTANPETLMIAKENKKFEKCLLDEKNIIVPDGIGIVKGANLLSYNIKETITGVELCKNIFEILNDTKKSIFLFGATDEVVNKLKKVLKNEYPNINILGVSDGYVPNRQEIFERIKALKPDVVLVALGIPDQELLIYNNLESFDKGIFIGVGGSFDVLSGNKKRAPKIFIKLHLEWLYRITVEPNRLKRFLKSNVKYIFKIIEER